MKSTRKNRFFFIVALALPIIFFLLLELIFRVVGVGKRETLVLKIEENGNEFYQLNPEVAKRYFLRTSSELMPQLYPQKFPVQKSENTIRIFLLGGSTMAGFPYQLNARINRLLQTRLEILYPQKNFEVLNFALSAVNSFTVLDFSSEILQYDPDLVIIYMGHNEFYGAFGIGSLERIGQNPGWIRFYLKLQKIRTFQLMRHLIAKISLKSQPEIAVKNQTLMEKMARQKAIPFESKEFKIACQYFSENLEKTISQIHSQGCPVVVSTLVSNLRDQFPFVSQFSSTVDAKQKLRWEDLFSNAKIALEANQVGRAIKLLNECQQIDSAPAKLHFMLGKCYFQQNDTSRALAEFLEAKDLDALRFRAPEIFNEIIRKTARKFDIHLIPLDSIFNAESESKIVGHDLIAEHLHPNIRGYELMADFFARAVVKALHLNSEMRNPNPSEQAIRENEAITLFDEAIGDVTIQRLTSRWPFQQRRELIKYKNPVEKIFTESLVKKYLANQISWNEAHYQMAEFYLKRNETEKALREYLAVLKIVPDNYFPYFKIGDIYFSQNKSSQAENWYRKALKRNHESFIKAKLGMVLLSLKKFAAAEEIFRDAILQEQKIARLSDTESSLLHYYYAICLVNNEKYRAAQNQLSLALKFDPQLTEAQNLLQLLKSKKRVKIKL